MSKLVLVQYRFRVLIEETAALRLDAALDQLPTELEFKDSIQQFVRLKNSVPGLCVQVEEVKNLFNMAADQNAPIVTGGRKTLMSDDGYPDIRANRLKVTETWDKLSYTGLKKIDSNDND